MDDDAGQDGTSPGDDSPADDLSDIGRARARGWFQNLLNLCRLHTGAECIGHFTEHFNLTESRALTLIFGHLYGSSLKEESPDELLFGLACRNWEKLVGVFGRLQNDSSHYQCDVERAPLGTPGSLFTHGGGLV